MKTNRLNGDEKKKDAGGAKSRPANQAMVVALAERIEKLNDMNKSLEDMVGGMDATIYNLSLTTKALEAKFELLKSN